MNDWMIFQNQATKSFISETIWKSFKREKQYKIISVEEERIVVQRLSGGNNAHFTKGEALRALERLKLHGRIKKGDLIHTAVRETMLVHLHPSVYWDSKSKEINWKEDIATLFDTTQKLIKNASDDELERIQIQIKKRRNQSEFRKNLLLIYENKCAITGNGPEAVLQAAHIINHSKSGINSNENGLLLRSDIHDLFDSGLLLIHPVNLIVHLHPSLKTTYYSKYEGKKIASRKDLSVPNEKYLEDKWNEFKWATL